MLQCPETIEATQFADCEWGFEVGSFQSGESATWTFGDDLLTGGHAVEYALAETERIP